VSVFNLPCRAASAHAHKCLSSAAADEHKAQQFLGALNGIHVCMVQALYASARSVDANKRLVRAVAVPVLLSVQLKCFTFRSLSSNVAGLTAVLQELKRILHAFQANAKLRTKLFAFYLANSLCRSIVHTLSQE
jgi:hypothetical protein